MCIEGEENHRSDGQTWAEKAGQTLAKPVCSPLAKIWEELYLCLSVQPNKEIKIVSAVRRSSVTSLAGSSNPYFTPTPSLGFLPAAECNPKSGEVSHFSATYLMLRRAEEITLDLRLVIRRLISTGLKGKGRIARRRLGKFILHAVAQFLF